MNGYEVLTMIRNEFPEDKRQIPIIIVSATSQPQKIQQVIVSGANGHLLKPYKEQVLYDKIIHSVFKSELNKVDSINENGKINLKTLEEFAEGDTDFMLELLEHFINLNPELRTSMQANFKSGNKELSSQLHKYRSQTSLLGLAELSDMCKELEHSIIEDQNQAFTSDELFNSIIIQSEEAVKEIIKKIEEIKKK